MGVEAERLAFDAAVEIVAGVQALDGPNVNPVCRTRLYTHGHRTDRALVLLHGFTNCPAQFDQLGRRFFDRGWNVLIPRYPRHGYSDRLNTSIAELTSDQLIAVANRSADAGRGLGERLTVAGMSLGGILTGHLAQSHEGIERAVMVAPMFGLKRLPAPALAALTQMIYVLPNLYIWWNSKARDSAGPPHGYPRFATRGYAALFTIASRVIAAARRAAPKTRSIGVITNAAEPHLDNRFTHQLVRSWRGHGATVDAFEFPASEKLPHDLIDPASNPPAVIDRVYPLVERFIEGS